MSPGEMQNVSPEEYMLMRSWTHIVIDGINGLLGAFSKKPEQKSAAVQSLKQTAAKAGIDIPDNLVPETESTPAAPTPTDNSINLSANSAHSQKAENINIDGIQGKNLAHLKNPAVYKAMTNSVADMKFAQYEQMGLLDLCIKQRKERLNQN